MTSVATQQFNGREESYYISGGMKLHVRIEGAEAFYYIVAKPGHSERLERLQDEVEIVQFRDLGESALFDQSPTLQLIVDADFYKYFDDIMAEIFLNAHEAADAIMEMRSVDSKIPAPVKSESVPWETGPKRVVGFGRH